MCDDGCSDCEKSQKNVVKYKICVNESEEIDDEKVLEVFGGYDSKNQGL